MTDQTQLEVKTNQYQSHTDALQQLQNDLHEANQTLEQLEKDTTGDLDKAAEKAAQTHKAIQDTTFKVNAMNKRQQSLRAEILTALKEETKAHKTAEKEAYQQRRALFDTIISDDDWKDAQKIMHALCYLYGGNWDSVCKYILPYEPTDREQFEAATELGLAIPDPEKPDAIEYAKYVINFDERFDSSPSNTIH